MYRNWIKEKIPLTVLIIILLITFLGLFIIEKTKDYTKYSYYNQQVTAAKLMKKSLLQIKDVRLAQGIPINQKLDPNETGIIGQEFTKITTTKGNLEAKRTATNPNFAALMVKYFNDLDLKEGDVIAIGASGSFPALILATLSAAKVMKLKPILIYSFGASMYGANIPEFTFITMLDNLQNLLPYQPVAVSLGGHNDTAEYMLFQESKPTLLKLAQSTGLPFIYQEDLATSIKERMDLYQQYAGEKGINCFINIGGASANFGALVNASLSFPNGLVLDPPELIPDQPNRGLIYEYALRDIPVIHLLNIRDLAIKNGISIDPTPFPPLGEGKVYYKIKYNKFFILSLLTIIIGLLGRAKNKKKSYS